MEPTKLIMLRFFKFQLYDEVQFGWNILEGQTWESQSFWEGIIIGGTDLGPDGIFYTIESPNSDHSVTNTIRRESDIRLKGVT